MKNELLKIDNNEANAENYISYIKQLKEKKKKEGASWILANPWATKIPDAKYIEFYKRVHSEGLALDGKHITIDTRGIQYDYVAFKNKMLIIYPESLIDAQLVYKGDEYSFAKENGKVYYKHIYGNVFKRKETDVLGGYCVIKNKRGEFLTTLTYEDIIKHKNVAKTKSIWNSWFVEMALKTIIRKSVKVHFDDIYQDMEEVDNVNYDLDKAQKSADYLRGEIYINKCKTKEDLVKTWGNIEENAPELATELKEVYETKLKEVENV